ncbi:MAG: acyl-CoA dehydrogenase family protein [Nitrospinales bacterium]
MVKILSHEGIIKDARIFANEVLRPKASVIDQKESLPKSIIKEMTNRRFLLANLPEEYGGLGLNPVHYGYLTEEIGKACCSTRGLMTVQGSLIGEVLYKWGTKEQKSKWLLPISRGEMLGAFALSEPEIGTDAKGIRTNYKRDGDDYVINGRKKWISFGEIADYFIVIASDHKEITAFIIERNLLGVSIYPIKGMLANRAAHIAEIEFKDVRIPKRNVIGKPGAGFSFIVSSALDHGRYSIAWAGVAVAAESLDHMATYAKKRKQFGRKIGEYQLVQRIISNAVANTHAARALCINAGDLRSRNASNAVSETTIAKYFTSRIAMKIASDAVQVYGGAGCSNQHPVERLFREAKLLEIVEGTSQIQQQIIARYGLRSYGKH